MKIRIQPKSPDPTLRKTRIRIRYNFGFIKIRIQPKSPDPILRKPLIGIRFNFLLIKNRIQPTSPDPPLRETRIRIRFNFCFDEESDPTKITGSGSDPTETRIRIRFNFVLMKIRIQPKSPDPTLRKTGSGPF